MQTFDKYIIDQSPSNFNYAKLKIMPESRYSCLMPWQIKQVKEAILQETDNMDIKSIIDCTANIGCDTILFRLLFPYADIKSIELDKLTYKALSNNMDNICQIVGKYVNPIQTINDDCLNYVFKNHADMIYFDPPWQGVDYKNQTFHNLLLSGYDIGNVINSVLSMYNSLIIVKVPFNFNFNLFNSQVQKTYRCYPIYTLSKNPKISYYLLFI